MIDEVISLSADQSALYEVIRAAMDDRVRSAIADRGLARSRISLLDALLKLRQVCCDPALVKLQAVKDVRTSAKRVRLLQLLEELIAEGRRVLIFSQFVKMRRMIEGNLKARGWKYAMLHGGTKAAGRDALIGRFEDGSAPVFLVSLKAGGADLNLTAADTVILYDPWWKPATEPSHGPGPPHRSGQARFVHRLIAEDTVEAAIQELKARKQALTYVLEGTGEGPMTMTEDDLGALFGGGRMD